MTSVLNCEEMLWVLFHHLTVLKVLCVHNNQFDLITEMVWNVLKGGQTSWPAGGHQSKPPGCYDPAPLDLLFCSNIKSIKNISDLQI